MSNTINTISGESLKGCESRNAQINRCSQKHQKHQKAIPSIDLSEVIMALEMTTDQSQAYFDTKTGEILWQYDFEPSLSTLSSEELEKDSKRYIQLPDQYEIYEYHMIEVFAYDHSENDSSLIRAITGRGAFRRFKDAVDRLGLSEEWYDFRDNCYRERAVSWCHGNDIKFTEKRKKR